MDTARHVAGAPLGDRPSKQNLPPGSTDSLGSRLVVWWSVYATVIGSAIWTYGILHKEAVTTSCGASLISIGLLGYVLRSVLSRTAVPGMKPGRAAALLGRRTPEPRPEAASQPWQHAEETEVSLAGGDTPFAWNIAPEALAAPAMKPVAGQVAAAGDSATRAGDGTPATQPLATAAAAPASAAATATALMTASAPVVGAAAPAAAPAAMVAASAPTVEASVPAPMPRFAGSASEEPVADANDVIGTRTFTHRRVLYTVKALAVPEGDGLMIVVFRNGVPLQMADLDGRVVHLKPPHDIDGLLRAVERTIKSRE